MSGVFGCISAQDILTSGAVLREMADDMIHRDWHRPEYYDDPKNGVALGRLAQGIFNPETQPFTSDNGDLVVFFTGEIYEKGRIVRQLASAGRAAVETRDEALIGALYRDKGQKFIEMLQGAFQVLIYDRAHGEILIANDRFGLYPLYYAHRDGRFVFAPTMKAVLSQLNPQPAPDEVAMAEYFRFQFLLGDKTFFEDVKLLPNAVLLRLKLATNRLQIDPYWDLGSISLENERMDFREAVEEAARRFRLAIERLTGGDHRFGVYLSGGLDSRLIAGLMVRSTQPLAVTYGLSNSRDMVFSSRLARRLNLEHRKYYFSDGRWVPDYCDLHLTLTEGFHSWIHMHGISILDQIHGQIDINLTGFGGGLTYVDWEDPVIWHTQDELTLVPKLYDLLWKNTTWPSMSETEMKLLFAPRQSSLQDLAFDSFKAELAKFDHLPLRQRAAYFGVVNPDRRMFQYFTVFHRAFVEQRFPFYDYDYFDFVYSLPPEMLHERKLRREVILQLIPEVAGVPYAKDLMPISRNKAAGLGAKLWVKGKTFVNRHMSPVFEEYAVLNSDYENWLREDLKEWGEGIMFDERTLQRGIFSQEFLRSLWNRHLSGMEVNVIGKLAPIITYELMLRRFVD